MKALRKTLLDFPVAFSEFHPTKNGKVEPREVFASSKTKYWWRCGVISSHEWEAAVGNRTGLGRGCPYCSGRLVSQERSLAAVRPDLAKEWHSIRNKGITPEEISFGSSKKVWWQCPWNVTHVYENTVAKRNTGRNCPFCSRRVFHEENSLLSKMPDVAQEWHPSKNGNLRPDQVSAFSNKKVWWACSKVSNHEWPAVIHSRTGKGRSGCPLCSNQVVSQENCLNATHPQIAKEWNFQRNLITPYDVVAGSNKKVWWKCLIVQHHEWEVAVCKRTGKNGTGCPYCSNKKTDPLKSLVALYPELAAQWDYKKNGTKRPEDFVPGSQFRAWWQCVEGPDHSWKTAVQKRALENQGCPFCAGRSVSTTNSLQSLYPAIAAQWDREKNGSVLPETVVAGSHLEAWWKCIECEDHTWKAKVIDRTESPDNKCPFCAGRKASITNSLKSLFPALAKEWNREKNYPLKTENVAYVSTKVVWWTCLQDSSHEWQTSVAHRTKYGTGCPFCTNRRISNSNSLAAKFPYLAKEWHPTKNGLLKPEDILYGSKKRIWWLCDQGTDHEWCTGVEHRTGRSKTGCPFCKNDRVSITNSLKARNPKLCKQWHPTLNGDLTPDQVVFSTHKKVWWLCPKGSDHEWQARVTERSKENGNNCPFCRGLMVSVTNSLATLFPQVAREWHPTKNRDLTPKNVVAGSHKSVWWFCDKGPDHEWQAILANRIKPGQSGCPFCRNLKASVTNSLASLFPSIAKEWHPTLNAGLTAESIVAGSEKRAWWICSKDPNHVWDCMVLYRTKKAGNCPWCMNYVNGTYVSQPQELLWRLTGGLLNHPVGKYKVDIALVSDTFKIAVEYDSWFWHQGKLLHDEKRDQFLLEKGWRVLRIRSNLLLPKPEQLKNALDRLKNGKSRKLEIVLKDWGKTRSNKILKKTVSK